jgi:hypothetical protein
MENENFDIGNFVGSDLEIAIKVMGVFIGTRNAVEETSEALKWVYAFDDETAEQLAKAAWEEWAEAYSG